MGVDSLFAGWPRDIRGYAFATMRFGDFYPCGSYGRLLVHYQAWYGLSVGIVLSGCFLHSALKSRIGASVRIYPFRPTGADAILMTSSATRSL